MGKRVIMDGVEAATARLNQKANKPADKPSASATASGYATMVQALYDRAAEMMAELEGKDGPVHQRAIALNTIAKSLPLIRAAEEAASTHIRTKDKDLKALSDAELRELANNNASRKGPIPHTERDAARLAPTRVDKAENEGVVGSESDTDTDGDF